MKLQHPLMAALVALSALAIDFFETSVYAPRQAQLDGKVVNANGQAFVIGASGPSTRCVLRDPQQCPPGALTLVNAEMTMLAAAVPGGQLVYVLPDGSITYSLPHTGSRPAVPQGRFFPFQVADSKGGSGGGSGGGGGGGGGDIDSPVTILSWRSSAGKAGLWICPTTPGAPVGKMAVVKASTERFQGEGCVAIGGLRMRAAGSAYGAWEYT